MKLKLFIFYLIYLLEFGQVEILALLICPDALIPLAAQGALLHSIHTRTFYGLGNAFRAVCTQISGACCFRA